jgi:hypothetical protein
MGQIEMLAIQLANAIVDNNDNINNIEESYAILGIAMNKILTEIKLEHMSRANEMRRIDQMS